MVCFPRGRRSRWIRNGSGETGVALLTVLGIIFIVSLLAVLVMSLAGREIIQSRNQYASVNAFYAADGGGMTARAATFALFNGLQANITAVVGGQSALATALANLYANGVLANQNPIKVLDYAGFSDASGNCTPCATIPTGATSAMASFTYIVTGQDATYPTKWISADTGSDVFQPIGNASYVARITVSRRRGASGLYIDSFGSSLTPAYVFHFTYTVQSRGLAVGATRRVQLTNNFDVTIQPLTFANYAYFDNIFAPQPAAGTCPPLSSYNWWDSTYTLDGPVHTNDRFWFMHNPTFKSTVEEANYSFVVQNGQCVPGTQASAGYVHFWENGSPADVNDYCSPKSPGCTMDNPTYTLGPSSFNRLAPYIAPATNLYSQERAALGGSATDTSSVTNQEINTDLGLCGTPPCNNPPPQGVYLPNNGGSTPALTGGIYVQDDNLKRLSFSIDTSTGSERQAVTFVQASGGAPATITVTTVIIDQGNNQTIVTQQVGSNSPTQTAYSGVPNGVMYVSGNIGKLGGRMTTTYWCPMDASDQQIIEGPAPGPVFSFARLRELLVFRPPALAAIGTSSSTSSTSSSTSSTSGGGGQHASYVGSCIQQNSQFTLAAGGNIAIDHHLRYEVDPRGPDGTWDNESGGNDDNLTVKNILGIVTTTGSIYINHPAPDNIVIDAFLLASQGMVQTNGYNTRPAQGTEYILGGKVVGFEGIDGITDGNGTLLNGYSMNLSWDQRVQFGRVVPPDYPIVTTGQPFAVTLTNLTAKPVWQEVL